MITRQVLKEAMSYTQFREMTDKLLAQGKTTGQNQSEEMVNYTKMNVHRMNRLDKKPEVNDALRERLLEIESEQIWLMIGEPWCGDVAQNLPTIQKMADVNPNISLKIILRDENPDLIQHYAYNGTLSIPRIIACDAEALEELWIWGPRPEPCQELMMQMKELDDLSAQEKAEKVHKWYAKDRTKTLQQEFEQLVELQKSV